MTTETNTPFALPAAPAFEKDNSHAMRALIYKSRVLSEWDKCADDDASRDIFFTVMLGIDSKQAYLTFRDNLKAWLRVFAASQKELKAKMHAPGGCSSSQMYASYSADAITRLIDLRRASKRWAGKQMEGARHTEAA